MQRSATAAGPERDSSSTVTLAVTPPSPFSSADAPADQEAGRASFLSLVTFVILSLKFKLCLPPN